MAIEVWLEEVATQDYIWYLKRLSANDTQLTGGHQAGPYVPKDVMFLLFPTLDRPAERNPDHFFDLTVDSDSSAPKAEARAVWYNNALHDNPTGGRNEIRLTRLGGRASPLLDVENTGALAVFAFRRLFEQGSANSCRVWICSTNEEESVENRWGPIEPGHWRLIDFSNAGQLRRTDAPCWLQPDDFPASWLENYPSAVEIIRKAVALRPATEGSADRRLIERRECEFEIFQSLEEAVELPRIRSGFSDITSFIQRANTILQRRKSRSGLSLELHLKTILEEEDFKEDLHFSYQAESEPGKRPDFLFPSAKAYGDAAFPRDRLKMLAVKTTCRDRWRQILNEADRIPTKHLLTLQEGVSPTQFQEMRSAGVRLVVPTSVHRAYQGDIKGEILDLATFIREARTSLPRIGNSRP